VYLGQDAVMGNPFRTKRQLDTGLYRPRLGSPAASPESETPRLQRRRAADAYELYRFLVHHLFYSRHEYLNLQIQIGFC